jgi:phage shock protein PspC (stress-responsive transcriptional regulator)
MLVEKLWIFLVEIGVVLTLLVIIIWWTLPRKKDGEKKD